MGRPADRYRLVWLEIAERQYIDLPSTARDLVDQLLTRLSVEPTAEADATYNTYSDQWSVPFASHGFLFYAVVQEHATVIILRVIDIQP
jgi:hypothetical protein